MFREVGFTELLFTSENGMGLRNGHIPGGQFLFYISFICYTYASVTLCHIAVNMLNSQMSEQTVPNRSLCHLSLDKVILFFIAVSSPKINSSVPRVWSLLSGQLKLLSEANSVMMCLKACVEINHCVQSMTFIPSAQCWYCSSCGSDSISSSSSSNCCTGSVGYSCSCNITVVVRNCCCFIVTVLVTCWSSCK